MPEGEIIKLVRHRGFGFLESDEIDTADGDIFFHHSSLEDTYFEDLKVGDEVKFELVDTPKGPEAVNISKVIQTTEIFENTEEPVDAEEEYINDEVMY